MRQKRSRIRRSSKYLIAVLAPILITDTRAFERCSICSDDGQLAYPNAIIPYYFLHGDDSVTCSDLEARAHTLPAHSSRCERYQTNAGYCGCPGAEPPVNKCKFCPTGSFPSKSEMFLPMGETCGDLHDYVSYMPEDRCTSVQYEGIVKHAYECGCDVSIPDVLHTHASSSISQNSCAVCPDGSALPNRNHYLEMIDMTCGEYSDMIGDSNSKQCEFTQNRGTHKLIAYQCDCPNASPPVCPLQENPQLCTVSLLNSVDSAKECDCYSFCDGEFIGCQNYPGKYLRSQCLGEGISGCNYSSAIDDVGDSAIDENFWQHLFDMSMNQ